MSKFGYSILLFLGFVSLWSYAIVLTDYRQDALFVILISVSFLYSIWIFVMSMMIQMNFFVNSVNQNSVNKVVLTFDDGPHPKHTVAILKILKKNEVNALFFVIGKNAKSHPELVNRIISEGHQIGTHTMNHKGLFGFLSGMKLKAEIQDAVSVIKEISGESPILFRPPFGVTNPLIAREIKDQGLLSVGWNVRSFDTPARTAQDIVRRVVSKVTKNSIVLLHDRIPLTVDALPQIITEIKGKGFAMGKLETK